MKHVLCLIALAACTYAQVSISPKRAEFIKMHPHYRYLKKMGRHPRDVTWIKKVGDRGDLFGILGQDGSGLFGKGGYRHEIFNDQRGKMDASAYGSRVLAPYGDSTKFGGGLNWANQNGKAAIDLSKPIGGHTALKATGEGMWHPNKNTDISAGGFYSQPFLGHGRPDYGVQAKYNLRY